MLSPACALPALGSTDASRLRKSDERPSLQRRARAPVRRVIAVLRGAGYRTRPGVEGGGTGASPDDSIVPRVAA